MAVEGGAPAEELGGDGDRKGEARHEVDQARWECSEIQQDAELAILRARDAVRRETSEKHDSELAVWDDMIALLKEKLAVLKGDATAYEEVDEGADLFW